MNDLIIATRNRHKVGEIRAIMEGVQSVSPETHVFRYLTLDDFPDAPAVVEDAETFEGNAAKKALSLAEWILQRGPAGSLETSAHRFVLADDSGLEVDLLNGAPGVHSARFAALDTDSKSAGEHQNAPDGANNAKLLRLLEGVPGEKRSARFRCVIALVDISPQGVVALPRFFDGACEGRIAFVASGGGGFGYDPLFVPAGYDQSFAELGEEIKNRISHRAGSLAKLRAWFGTGLGNQS